MDVHDPLKYGMLAACVVLVILNNWSLAIVYINTSNGDNKTLNNR
jgi:hypothetical protein